MAASDGSAVTVLGLGAMGSALANAFVGGGHEVTVWNRTPGKATELIAAGAREADDLGAAVTAGDVIVACLFDHASVHETLDPVVDQLCGRTLINLTTTTPANSRELAEWAAAAGIAYLDGGIMAVPLMIGGPGSHLLYSGDKQVFEDRLPTLKLLGTSTFHGDDAGAASLIDLALLSGMYAMFAGYLHGVAMVRSIGVSAIEFAAMSEPFLAAMTGGFGDFAKIVDRRDYSGDGQQSLTFSDLGDLIVAGDDAGIDTRLVAAVQHFIRGQIDAGYGSDGFARIVESIANPTHRGD